MANSFIDTTIWKKVWFRKLSPVNKVFYYYMISNCDHAGIFDVDIEAVKFLMNSNDELDKNMFLTDFKIIEITDCKWFLIDFLKLQYPKGLNSDKPAIKSVRERIIELNLDSEVRERFGNDYLIIKE